jgi:hypothetical protein
VVTELADLGPVVILQFSAVIRPFLVLRSRYSEYTQLTMAASSLDELKGRISAGRYAVSPADVADEIVSKFTLVRRVSRLMRDGEAERGQRRDRGRGRPNHAPSAHRRPRVS